MDKELLIAMRNAIKSGNLNLVKELISANEELLNAETPFGSWLHVAADKGKYDIAQFLISCGIDVNKDGGISGGNPVHSAARNGQLEVVKLLHHNGAKFDVSAANKNPLFGAICNGCFEVVKYLVENGINISAHYPIGKLKKVDAYEYARQYGQTEIANYLKEKLAERHG